MNKKMLFKLTFMLVAGMLLLAGCGQAKIDKADSERIAVMEEKIDALLNKEKDDIVEGIEEKQFDEIDELLEKEEGNEFSEENALRIGSVVLYLSQAQNMFVTENKVASLIDEDGVVDEELYEEVTSHIETLKEYETYYERQIAEINEVEKLYKEQVAQNEHIEETKQALAKLFTKEDKVKSDVTQKQHDEIAKLVGKVKDEEVKTAFEKDLKKVDDKIKAIAKAEKEEADRKAEEEKQQQLAQQKEQESKQQSNSVQSNQTVSNSNASSSQQSGTVNKSNGSSSKNNSATSSSNSNSSDKGKSSGSSNKSNTNNNSSNSNKGSSNSSNKGNNNNSSSNKGSGSGDNGFMNGMTDKEINDYFNNSDCTHVESGDIGDGGSYDKYGCK